MSRDCESPAGPLFVDCDHWTHQPLPVPSVQLVPTSGPLLAAEEDQSMTVTACYCRESSLEHQWKKQQDEIFLSTWFRLSGVLAAQQL